MARQLDISSQLYGQYENNQKVPGGEFFMKWREVFNEDLLSVSETKVSHGTKTPEERLSLERSIENMTIDKLKTTAIMERLVMMLEKQFGIVAQHGPHSEDQFGNEDLRQKKTSTKAG